MPNSWPDYRPAYGNQFARALLTTIRWRWGASTPAGIKATRCINQEGSHLGHSQLGSAEINYIYDAVVRAWGAPTQQAAADELDHPVLYPVRLGSAKKLDKKPRTRFLLRILNEDLHLVSGRHRIKKAKKKSGRKGKKTGGKAKR